MGRKNLRWDAKRDANELEIINALRECGAKVLPLNGGGIPDLLVYFHRWFVIEVKTKTGKKTKRQNWDLEIAPGAVPFCNSIEKALDTVGIVGIKHQVVQHPAHKGYIVAATRANGKYWLTVTANSVLLCSVTVETYAEVGTIFQTLVIKAMNHRDFNTPFQEAE